jgi:hypothetical protein
MQVGVPPMSSQWLAKVQGAMSALVPLQAASTPTRQQRIGQVEKQARMEDLLKRTAPRCAGRA